MKLTQKLYQYAQEEYLSFHTPGHKGTIDLPVSMLDVTELEETDNLFEPTGIIAESQQELAASLGCNQAIFLPNGATSGNLGVFFSLFLPGDRVVVDRNCHISVINALVISGVQPIFTELYVQDGLPLPVTAETIENLLCGTPDIKGVFLTSPNYYGMLADVGAIAEVTHRFDIPLIVDEAHGTHLYYVAKGKKSALHQGADISILSLHKNLPVLTQCGAIAYNNSGFDKIKQGVKYFTSTSPSYLLMSAMDQLADRMRKTGICELQQIINDTLKIREKMKKIQYVSLTETALYDPTRIVISVNGCGAEDLAAYLKENHKIVCEMTDRSHIVFIVTLCNTKRDLDRLYQGICDGAEKLGRETVNKASDVLLSYNCEMQLSPRKAYFSEKEEIPLSEAVGRIAGENLICFPPSVPICVMGEKMTEQTLENIYQFAGRETVLAVKQEKIRCNINKS